MKKTLMRLAVVALPMLIASCGGDDFFGSLDGGSGMCTPGVTPYQIKDAVYPPVTGSATLQDGCMTGLMAKDLETSRKISNDQMGNITLTSSDGTVIVGTGPVRCNASTLSYGPVGGITDGVCRFTATYSTDLVVTAANTFTMAVTQTRANSRSEPGMSCTQPATGSCTVKYTVSQKLQ